MRVDDHHAFPLDKYFESEAKRHWPCHAHAWKIAHWEN